MRKTLNRMVVLCVILALLVSVFAIPVSATGTNSKWTLGGNATITGESTETWVTQTAVVDLKDNTGWVQLDEKLTELIGANGEDGKGTIQIIPENVVKDSAYVQLVGDPTVTTFATHGDNRGLTWYIFDVTAHNFTSLTVNGAAGGVYAMRSNLGDEGYQFAFTLNANGHVNIRGLTSGAHENVTTYANTVAKGIVPNVALKDVVGDAADKSGLDGVYFRLQSSGEAADYNYKYTVIVTYPKPAASTLKAGKTSSWTTGGNAVITSETTETMVYDTVQVDMKDAGGWIQNNQKLTALIGENKVDGKGFIQVIPEKLKPDWTYIQLVGDPAATDINVTADTKAMTWLTVSVSAASFTGFTVKGQAGAVYGMHSNIGTDGIKVVFSQDADGKVIFRGIGSGVHENSATYDASIAKSVVSKLKLSEIVGEEADETGEDGVYFRLASAAESADANLKYTVTVAYPEPVAVNNGPVVPNEPNKPTGDASLMLMAALLVMGGGILAVMGKKRVYSK